MVFQIGSTLLWDFGEMRKDCLRQFTQINCNIKIVQNSLEDIILIETRALTSFTPHEKFFLLSTIILYMQYVNQISNNNLLAWRCYLKVSITIETLYYLY